MVNLGEVVKSRNFLLKLLELLLAIISVGLSSDALVGDTMEKIAVVDGTLVSSILLAAVLIAGEFLGTPVDKVLHMMVAGVLAVLSIAAGAIMIEIWDSQSPIIPDRVVGAGVLALFNGVVYIVDFILNFIR
ncbi:uncharacterized protein [Periplaneta americana]|uniref:uncharacterized protein isoform X2 n=1 Tax=Periplaneta americana TaxID=6978 RepID=UPI0037E992B1